METYNKIQTLYKRDLDGSITGQKGRMLRGQWTTPELEYLAGNEWEWTRKLDGTNIRIGWNSIGCAPSFGGRTNNAVIPKPLLEYLDHTFSHELFEKAFDGLDRNTQVILFGEGIGPKIQGGEKYQSHHSFVLFDVKVSHFWLDRKDVDDVAHKMGINSVSVAGYGTLHEAVKVVESGLTSTFGDFEEEGLVCRPRTQLFNRKGERIIVKVKGVDFK